MKVVAFEVAGTQETVHVVVCRGSVGSAVDNHNLKQKEAQSVRAESTRKGVNWRLKDVTQTHQQRPKSPG